MPKLQFLFMFFVIIPVLAMSGCAALIVTRGKDLTKLENRDQVHQCFGSPTSQGSDDGNSFESFRTRKKVKELTCDNAGMGMGYCITLGFAEFFYFPEEVFVQVRRVIRGQEIRFTYNEHGEVSGASIDGKSIFGYFPGADRIKSDEKENSVSDNPPPWSAESKSPKPP